MHRGVLRDRVAVPFRHGDRRQDVRRGVGADDQVDLVLTDQPLVQRRHLRLVGLVVEHQPLDRTAEQPAAGVEPVDVLLAGDLVDHASGAESTGQRQRRPDDDRITRRRGAFGPLCRVDGRGDRRGADDQAAAEVAARSSFLTCSPLVRWARWTRTVPIDLLRHQPTTLPPRSSKTMTGAAPFRAECKRSPRTEYKTPPPSGIRSVPRRYSPPLWIDLQPWGRDRLSREIPGTGRPYRSHRYGARRRRRRRADLVRSARRG